MNLEILERYVPEDLKNISKRIEGINLSLYEYKEWFHLINREAFIGPVESVVAYLVGTTIIDANRQDKNLPIELRKPIKIFINSDGGSLTDCMYICNLIEISKTPVYTINCGSAYSAGGLILMAGHRRYTLPDATALIHDGSTGIAESMSKVYDYNEFLKAYTSHNIKEYILRKTKITEEEYDKNYRKDWFLLPNEIIKYGLADEIIQDIDILL